MKQYRHLFDSLAPSHYQLSLDLNINKLTFTGELDIQAAMKAPSSEITLHANGLKVTEASVDGQPAKISYQEKDDYLILSLDKEATGNILISIKYQGEITDQLHGIYPSKYKVNGQETVALATQFESHHAREALPCIDEPAAKATFQLSLTASKDKQFISNTPITKSSINGSQKTVEFDKTPIMSTYLLAFVVGELASSQKKMKDGTDVAVWTTPDKIKQADFALQVAVDTLEYFQEYFDIDYPLSKCDLIAIPDFVTGAMENWGCILFRETAMLVDKNTSQTGKQWVAEVVAHELAHQWFGNLVTMEWWTDLWLNEGFASWVASLAVDKLFPEWNVWTDFVLNDVFRGQDLDSLESSHPVEVNITDPDEIRSIFDAISYSKGGSVLHMLCAYMGRDPFRDGLRAYLKKHAYGNAQTQDLWQSLEETSGLPIKDFMHTWTSKTGFPVVSVTLDKDEILLSQKRYLSNGSPTKEKVIWPIPLFNSGDDSKLDTVEARIAKSSAPLPLNQDRKGFYFTQYDELSISELGQQLANGPLPELDRLGLLHETAQLTKSGHSKIDATFTLLGKLNSEDRAHVWEVAAGFIGDVRRVFGDDETILSQLRAFTGELIADSFAKITLEPHDNEDHNQTLIRPVLTGLAAFSEKPEIIEMAQQKVSNYLKNSETIHPDLQSTFLSTAARHGDKELFEALLAQYRATESVQEKMKLSVALCSFKQPDLHEKCRQLIKSDDVRSQDVYFWIAYLFGNRYAKNSTWQWLKDEWDWLHKTFATDIATFAYLPKFSAKPFASQQFADDFTNFFQSAETKGIDLQVKQGLETILWQADWHKRDEKRLKSILTAQS